MPYTRPYAGGFVNYPTTTTPIDATALNTMDVGIKTANDQFQTVTTVQRTALSPTVGQAVWDSDLRQLMVFMNASGGNAWQPVGNTIVCTSTTRPSVPFEGQRIYETNTNRWFTYSGAAFVPDDLVFTNEAARDAAITSPTEGMRAYLTAPTVPAATGGTTLLPSGIETVYNGSVWVCRTSVCAVTNNAGTTASTSYTATLGGSPGTNPSVTLVTGTTALLQYYCESSAGASSYAFISVAVSGAGIVAAAEAHGSATNVTSQNPGGRTIILGGLTAGTNTFTLQYKTNNATCTWVSRTLTVTGVA